MLLLEANLFSSSSCPSPWLAVVAATAMKINSLIYCWEEERGGRRGRGSLQQPLLTTTPKLSQLDPLPRLTLFLPAAKPTGHRTVRVVVVVVVGELL